MIIRPGKTIGMLGGGQLGRMTGQAAREMGYGFHVFDPTENCPAGHVADVEINAPYTDTDALTRFAQGVDVISYEFENVSTDSLHELEPYAPILPDPEVLRICQHREREKLFLDSKAYPLAPFAVIDSVETLQAGIERIGAPCVLKTAAFGYDGKGQLKIEGTVSDYPALWKEFEADRAVLEGWIEFDQEISVIIAQGANGESAHFPVAENIHTHHILDFSIVPARISEETAKAAIELAHSVAKELGVVGLLAVELFVLKDGSLAINEMAPRPHNSGHYTMSACATSQFEQFVRAFTGLPLGSTELLQPVTMVNLLGDLWQPGLPPIEKALAQKGASLHLYGKAEARPGRKMGHINVLAETNESAFRTAQAIKQLLQT